MTRICAWGRGQPLSKQRNLLPEEKAKHKMYNYTVPAVYPQWPGMLYRLQTTVQDLQITMVLSPPDGFFVMASDMRQFFPLEEE